jgi:hypothetical protein
MSKVPPELVQSLPDAPQLALPLVVDHGAKDKQELAIGD